MKAIGRRDSRGQIIIYPEPRPVRGWWTGAIRRLRHRYLECHYHADYIEWIDVTEEVLGAVATPAPQEEPTP